MSKNQLMHDMITAGYRAADYAGVDVLEIFNAMLATQGARDQLIKAGWCPPNGPNNPSQGEKPMNLKTILHTLRNPYLMSAEAQREARLEAADLLEQAVRRGELNLLRDYDEEGGQAGWASNQMDADPMELLRDIDANMRRAWADGSLSSSAWPTALAMRLSDALAKKGGA